MIAVNIRRARILRGYTQDELARRARVAVSTVYHAELGRALSRRSLQSICEGLGSSLDHIRARGRRHLTQDHDLLVHRREEGVWTAEEDRRSKAPEDNLVRIQDPAERLRLGHLDLVPLFLCAVTFIMPEGPGPLLLELYGRYEGALNQTIYRDCLLLCSAGEARVAIAGEEVEMRSGDLVGYRSKDLRWMEPLAPPTQRDGPVRLTWIGAVRLGKLPTDFGQGVRVRPRRGS